MTNHSKGNKKQARHSAWLHLLCDYDDGDATCVYDVTSGTPFLYSPLKIIVGSVLVSNSSFVGTIGRSAGRSDA
jgi:hypothetical protein